MKTNSNVKKEKLNAVYTKAVKDFKALNPKVLDLEKSKKIFIGTSKEAEINGHVSLLNSDELFNYSS